MGRVVGRRGKLELQFSLTARLFVPTLSGLSSKVWRVCIGTGRAPVSVAHVDHAAESWLASLDFNLESDVHHHILTSCSYLKFYNCTFERSDKCPEVREDTSKCLIRQGGSLNILLISLFLAN